ncbi:hypothetical protein PIB30_087460, partial [Stylosanthes scabra]|nr:hypothetical protein [Stylosanthes scabra]
KKKRKKTMANKNGATLAISIMLTILVIICSSIDNKKVWSTSYYYITYNEHQSLEYCAYQCMRQYKNNAKKKEECILECIKRRCSRLYPNDEEKTARMHCGDCCSLQQENLVWESNKFQQNSNREHKSPVQVPKSKPQPKK